MAWLMFMLVSYFVFTVGGIRLLFWMDANCLETWDDLFSFARRKRQCHEALARGAMPCGCHYGLVSRAFPTKWNKWEPCQDCGGTGAVLEMPERTVLR